MTERWPGAALVAGGVGLNLALAASLNLRGAGPAIAFALLPALLLAFAALISSRREVLVVAALGLPLTALAVLARPLPLGGAAVYVPDLIVGVALAVHLAGVLVARANGGEPRRVPWTPVLGWPLVLFGAAIVVAVLRGHVAYGSSLLGQPLRLVLYAAIAFALVGLTPARLYRLLLVIFYAGSCWLLLAAVAGLGAGGTQTALSTGGERLLSISGSLYMAGTLFLALLSLRVEARAGWRLFHLGMAALGLVGVVLGFGRAVFMAVAIGVLVLVVLSGQVRRTILVLVPLALPFLVVAALLVPRAVPDLWPSFVNRISAPPTRDANVEWRVKANRAVLAQVRESPLVGVGFGRTSYFTVDVRSSSGLTVPQRIDIEQDPHNGYLFLLAGGGVVTLGAFLLVLAAFARDAVRRYRGNRDPVARLILLWCALLLFVFLFNAASGTMFESPFDLLTIWTLLVLPAVVPREQGGREAGGGESTEAARPGLARPGLARPGPVRAAE
jgi:hypothetical protein